MTEFKNPLAKRALEQRYDIHLPAGLGNLSFPVREQIKAQHNRRIERIRAALKNGREPHDHELALD